MRFQVLIKSCISCISKLLYIPINNDTTVRISGSVCRVRECMFHLISSFQPLLSTTVFPSPSVVLCALLSLDLIDTSRVIPKHLPKKKTKNKKTTHFVTFSKTYTFKKMQQITHLVFATFSQPIYALAILSVSSGGKRVVR